MKTFERPEMQNLTSWANPGGEEITPPPSDFASRRDHFSAQPRAQIKGGGVILQPPGSAGGLPGRPHWELLASQKSSFSTGFIRYFVMAECHVVYSEKPNAFLIILEAILRFGFQNDWNSTGFIRYSDQLFPMLQNALGPMLFQHFVKS